MAAPVHVTLLLIAPPARSGGTTELYRTDTGSGSLLGRALAAAIAWTVDDIVLVLGDGADDLLDGVDSAVTVLVDPEWSEGPAAALRSGFDLVAREEQSDAVLVLWLDRTLPGADVVEAVLDRAGSSDRPIVAAKYRYAVDHPVLVRTELWSRILGMEGAGTLDSLIATHPEWVDEAWVDSVPPQRFQSADDIGSPR